MIRVILARNDLLTPFDLRAENFRVNVEFSTWDRGPKIFSKKCPKVTFRLEKNFFLNFFVTVGFGPLVSEKIYQKKFWAERVLSDIFSKVFFSILAGKIFSRFSKNENILPATILLDFYHTASSWDASFFNVTMWQSDSHRLTQEEAATGFSPAAHHTFPKNEKLESLRVSGNHKIIFQGKPPE